MNYVRTQPYQVFFVLAEEKNGFTFSSASKKIAGYMANCWLCCYRRAAKNMVTLRVQLAVSFTSLGNEGLVPRDYWAGNEAKFLARLLKRLVSSQLLSHSHAVWDMDWETSVSPG